MTSLWPSWLRALFEAPSAGVRRPLDIRRFDLGICRGCRRLRLVASPRCESCASTAPVEPDA